MFCPNCKCEYLAGVTECADCGVPLVRVLDSSEAPPLDGGGIVSIWSGNDPHECAAVKEALEKAGVTAIEPDSNAYFIFPSMRPKMEICVASANEDKAQKVLLEMEGRADLDELPPEELDSLALPVSDDVDHDEDTASPDDLPEDWDDQEAASEVWSGEQEDVADTLIACFRENGIPSRKLTEGPRFRLVVRPNEEARSKEIVREVVEASPPG
jgi:hypothetical protein